MKVPVGYVRCVAKALTGDLWVFQSHACGELLYGEEFASVVWC